MKTIKIAPSILAADFARLGQQVAEAEADGADYIDVDVMDGTCVPNFGMCPAIVHALHRPTSLPLDTHLMITRPERHLASFRQAGADLLTVHAEACPDLHQTVLSVKRLGCRVGVALNPATPLTTLSEILCYVDLVLVMTVSPGQGRQKFIDGIVPKIERVRAMLDSTGCGAELEVDGGFGPDTAPLVVQAGANVLVAGTAVLGVEAGIGAAIAQIRSACQVRVRADEPGPFQASRRACGAAQP